jgi:hypothetical protein
MPETSLADRPGRVNDGHGRAPLSGIRVIEVGNYMAGPFCGMQLADLGAEVIKVEHPDGGDQVRSSAPLIDGEGSAFMRLNRNKRSVALDLKSVAGKGVFRRPDLRGRIRLGPGRSAEGPPGDGHHGAGTVGPHEHHRNTWR